MDGYFTDFLNLKILIQTGWSKILSEVFLFISSWLYSVRKINQKVKRSESDGADITQIWGKLSLLFWSVTEVIDKGK